MLYVYNLNVTVDKYMHVLALDNTAVAVSGTVDPVKPVNHTGWVAVVTPKSPNSLVGPQPPTFFEALFVLSLCPFDISAGVGAFVIGLSQIFSVLSLSYCT